jgi:hypothetical protein
MAMEIASPHDVFPHIRIVMGMVIGLGVTRLLSGVARIVLVRERRFHTAFVAAALIYQISFILRLFDTIV